ncbi:T9SS type A sorting domain-containing protein [Flavobacterium bizetiae]|uniref:T9SS type A sorting domain-containing protein n=1 Tax=Flavobacterium bizetiae TaxID=2704140 RepID=UPI0021E7844B|nr:T9SS type A sorting domain-containing protein [Flavobacterium bizetiae]UTN02613.1 T9SS type A sorting domain-containing protein [Flavobacterium bizetiae]
MKKTILLILILTTTKSVSQIYFSPSAYMYVKSEVLFVQQDINLGAGSNLYLRNNSQLVQGTTGTSTNSGTGTVSVYQEGTTNNYSYNYWCSPVGSTVPADNGQFGITMLGRPTSATISTPATILPATTSDGTSSPLAIASKWIYKLSSATSYSQWVFVGNTTTLAPGEGFSMKGTSGTDSTDPEGTGVTNNPGSAQRYDFKGKPNDGTITIILGANSSTLTGNPYPSALNLNEFLFDSENAATGGAAYFWEQDKTVNSHTLINYRGGYDSYAPMTRTSQGVYTPATFSSYNGDGSMNPGGSLSPLSINRRYLPIGQGFVINATATGTAKFKNSHRIFMQEAPGSSQFERPASKDKNTKKEDVSAKNTEEVVEQVSHFKLNTIINNQFTRQLALAFVPEATDGIDYGMDALNMDDDLPSDVTFWLEDGSYVIQGVNFDENKKIALIAKATTNTTFKFFIPEVINFDPNQKIYIYDALDDSYHDVKNGTYEVSVTPGVYNDRFKITFKDATTLGVENNSLKQFFISQDNINKNLKASNPNNFALKSFKLYDVLGKTVLSKKDLGTDENYTFSTTGLSSGIYISEFLTTDNQRFIEKIVISNSGK